jgi:hypothetical protein
VAKASAGALEHVRVARVTNLVRLIDEFKQHNIWTIGASADARVDYTEWDWTSPCALVLGGEGAGLHRLVREHCDALVRIPARPYPFAQCFRRRWNRALRSAAPTNKEAKSNVQGNAVIAFKEAETNKCIVRNVQHRILMTRNFVARAAQTSALFRRR